MPMLDTSTAAAVLERADALAACTEEPGRLTRRFGTAALVAAGDLVCEWMRAAGMEARRDAIGNVVGRWEPPGGAPAGTLLLGSHLDTVVDAGRYDGMLGVLIALACVERLGADLPFAVEVYGFADEEGVRYRSTFLGSSALAGTFDSTLLDAVDADGIAMRDAIHDAGLDPHCIGPIARDRACVAAFVEVHIEQGPVLLEAGRALGVVTAIAGSVRLLASVQGVAGHAGTVPMGQRRDAAAAAAEVVLEVERRCGSVAGLVGTVGMLAVPGGAINVIPGRCELSIDIRAGADVVRDAAVADVLAAIERIAERRRVNIDVRRVLEAAGVPCAPALQDQFAASIMRTTGFADALRLPSGAGHDAMKMAGLAPVGMLFVRCGNGGISHHPDEILDAADAETAGRAFIDFLLHFRAD